MAMIKGITVTYIGRIRTGKDEFDHPVYEEYEEDIENVLVAPASSTDIVDQNDLNGKKAVYTLAIPKEDTHNWADCRVRFFGQTWKSFGFPTMGIDELIPLGWNKKVMVELYG